METSFGSWTIHIRHIIYNSKFTSNDNVFKEDKPNKAMILGYTIIIKTIKRSVKWVKKQLHIY